MNKTISPKIVALTFGILVISFLAAFYVVAWQEPSQAPPGGNVSAPLNVGPAGQSKSGGLILNTGGAEYGLIIDKGKTQFGGSLILKPISRPLSPQEGQVYFDQGDKKMYYYNGVEWVRIGLEAPLTCPVCQIYSSELKKCVNLPAGTKDANCSALHYACDGAGKCTAPKSYHNVYCQPPESGKTWTAVCLGRGYDGFTGNCTTVWGYACGEWQICDGICHCSIYGLCTCGQCWNWVYD